MSAHETPSTDVATLLQRFGFDQDTFDALRMRLQQAENLHGWNALKGTLAAPQPEQIASLKEEERAKLQRIGLDAMGRGQVGVLVLAGGMATRFGGVVKATVPVLEKQTFLDLKLQQFQFAENACGHTIPVFLMTSFATDVAIRDHVASHSQGMNIQCFAQSISLRVLPDGTPFRDGKSKSALYAPGHGDTLRAFQRSGLLDSFVAKGGKWVFVSNVDNLGADLDPVVLGSHIQSKQQITVEVVDKHPGDAGGAPALVNGNLQIVEGFRFPPDFDQSQIPVFNTNTFIMDAQAMGENDRASLDWFIAKKKVDGQDVIQFEQLLGQVTAFYPTQFLRVPRQGVASRFTPVKDPAELQKRLPEIRDVLSRASVAVAPLAPRP